MRTCSPIVPVEHFVNLLADEIERAAAAAVAECEVLNPFVVELRVRDYQLPPFVRVGGAGFGERVLPLSRSSESAVDGILEAGLPDAATLELRDRMSPQALAACERLNQERAQPGRPEPCGPLEWELARRLSARAWPGAADPFLVLVNNLGYGMVDPYKLAAVIVGGNQVAAFHSWVVARVEALYARTALPLAARREPDALQALLAERGLGRHAHRLAHEVAQLGLRLQPTPFAKIQSRLGGPPLLPPGGAWPRTASGAPLTFLAGIDLAELAERDGLPDAGWLLFFSEVENDAVVEGLMNGPEANALGASARLIYVPPDVEPVEVETPEDVEYVLAQRWVVAVPQLTLPDDYEVAERLGLSGDEEDAYDQVAARLRWEEGWSPEVVDHWVLGACTNVQFHPTDPDTVLLLHLSDDESLGFNFLSAGNIQFRISRVALEARDWSAVTAQADST